MHHVCHDVTFFDGNFKWFDFLIERVGAYLVADSVDFQAFAKSSVKREEICVQACFRRNSDTSKKRWEKNKRITSGKRVVILTAFVVKSLVQTG